MNPTWIHGAPGEPPIQTHWYDERTVILRQSKSLNYEAPFMYLLFGSERALLLDTGATEDPQRFPLRETVDRLIGEWTDLKGYELVVAHSHGHGDHVAGDGQFAGRPNTVVVPRELDAVQSFFGFDDWPAQTVMFDLGGRVLEILGSPGHHPAAITIYDPATGILLTGDTVLPGRLYIADTAAYLSTMDRMVAFAAARPVTDVLGCHVEMTRRPRRDFPLGADYQPNERALELTPAHLTAIRDATAKVAGRPGVYRYDDFIIYNEPRKRDALLLMARARAHKLLHRHRR
jgi:hydroxyacylglutathione hydrolase